MLEQQYALPFAAWELRLYLHTHPEDGAALAAYTQLCAQAGPSYADAPAGNGWQWIQAPWPWEYAANEGVC